MQFVIVEQFAIAEQSDDIADKQIIDIAIEQIIIVVEQFVAVVVIQTTIQVKPQQSMLETRLMDHHLQ